MEFRQFMTEDTAHRFRQSYRRMGITCRLGRPGSAQDSAVIDSWHSTLEFKLSSLAWTAVAAGSTTPPGTDVTPRWG